MADDPIQHGLLLATMLFGLGLFAVLARRNVIFILMGVEIMLNAAGLVFVLGGARWGEAGGQVMFIMVLAIAAAEVSVGLALLLQLFHRQGTVNADAAKRMRG